MDFSLGPIQTTPFYQVTPLVEFCSSCWICQNLYRDFSNLLDLSKVVTWICPKWYIVFSKLLRGFLKNHSWISLSCYMDLSRLLHGFVKVLTLDFMYFLPLVKQNQAEVWPRFQSMFKVLNALGPMCLWKCFRHTSVSNINLWRNHQNCTPS